MRLAPFFLGLVLISCANGCGAIRGIEQWKCDNWGMCHFAPRKPGMMAPMAVQPGYAPAAYGAPSSGAVMPPGYSSGPMTTTAPGYPAYGAAGIPTRSSGSNCQSCTP